MKTEITKGHIDQLEREVMALVPSGKPYKAFKGCFNDLRQGSRGLDDEGIFRQA